MGLYEPQLATWTTEIDIRKKKLEVKKNAKCVRCLILIALTPELWLEKRNGYILNRKTTGYFHHLNIDNDVMTWCVCVNEEILPHVSFLSGHQKN